MNQFLNLRSAPPPPTAAQLLSRDMRVSPVSLFLWRILNNARGKWHHVYNLLSKMFTLGESEQKSSGNSCSISVTLQLLCQSKKIKEKQNVFETWFGTGPFSCTKAYELG